MGQFIWGILCLVIGIIFLVYSFSTPDTQFVASFIGGLLVGHGVVMAAFGARDR